jgi:hypothetical protein
MNLGFNVDIGYKATGIKVDLIIHLLNVQNKECRLKTI